MSQQSPIDVVLTWVDPSDAEWQLSKSRHAGIEVTATIDASEERYRDWGTLKYVFRGIDRYMPWIRTVHFVTCGQKPEWLNPAAAGLALVDHSDFIPSEYLPTFNINPIELNFHRIPGLANRFIYFNDDMFCVGDARPSDFFDGMKVRDQAAFHLVCPDERFEDSAACLWMNNTSVLAKHFHTGQASFWKAWLSPKNGLTHVGLTLLLNILSRGRMMPMFFHHLPLALLKSCYSEVWEAETDLLDSICRNRFRSRGDLSVMLIKDWQILRGLFVPSNVRSRGAVVWNPTQRSGLRRVEKALSSSSIKLLCVNDSDTGEVPFAEASRIVRALFEAAFPTKSRFEVS